MGVPQPVLVCAVLLGLFTPTPTGSSQADEAVITLNELTSLLDYLQNRETLSGNEISNINGNRLNDMFPSETLQIDQDDDHLSTEKRAGYMTLCHFKICNMGRKRDYAHYFKGRNRLRA